MTPTRLQRLEAAAARAKRRADHYCSLDVRSRRASVAVRYRNKRRMWDRITWRRQRLVKALRAESVQEAA